MWWQSHQCYRILLQTQHGSFGGTVGPTVSHQQVCLQVADLLLRLMWHKLMSVRNLQLSTAATCAWLYKQRSILSHLCTSMWEHYHHTPWGSQPWSASICMARTWEHSPLHSTWLPTSAIASYISFQQFFTHGHPVLSSEVSPSYFTNFQIQNILNSEKEALLNSWQKRNNWCVGSESKKKPGWQC